MSSQNKRFKNRESSNSNRRKLIIESESENEIIAHIYRADTDIIEEGTKIDADVLNEWDGKVERAYALTQIPDTTEADTVGNPRIEVAKDGRLKFIAFKGATGKTGLAGTQGPKGDVGPQGFKGDKGNGAGFGEITANVVMIEAESEPQASVFTSGEDTAKSLAFRFRLPKGPKGDVGSQGVKGDKGNGAGFGEITANVVMIEAESEPQANVFTSGEDTAKSFAFSFRLPKGPKGDVGPQGVKGDTGSEAGFGAISASAVMLEAGSEPQASVLASGNNMAKNLTFEFGVPKGNKGDAGPQGVKGETGNAGGFGVITANAVMLEEYSDPHASVIASGDNASKNLTFEFGLPKGIKGDVGNSIFVRYSFDKNTITELPLTNTRYIGFYTGKNASENPLDYKWTHLWGAKSTSMQEYSDMLSDNRLDEEQIYFVEGASENKIDINIDRLAIAAALGLSSDQLEQLVELAKITTVTGVESKEISFIANSINIQ